MARHAAASVSASGSRPPPSSLRQRCYLHHLRFGQRVDRPLVASQSTQPPPPPSRQAARQPSAVRLPFADTFASASGSTAPLSPHQRLDGRRPRLASSLRQRCSCPTGGSTRRRLRLGQRLDDRRHHLSVSGATATTFASAGGSTAPPSPHQQLNPRRLRLDQPPSLRPEARTLLPLSRQAARSPSPSSLPQRCYCPNLRFGTRAAVTS